MLKKLMTNLVVAMAIVLLLSLPVFARESVTCSGGRLYLEQTLPNGEELCWDTGLTCGGEWTYSWLIVKNTGDTSTANTTSTARVAPNSELQEATRLLQSVKKTDLKLYYKAPSSVVQAFKERASWPTRDKGPIKLPPNSPGPTFPDPPPIEAKAKGYPPHGYPCLGCEPCPPPQGTYCDTTWKKNTNRNKAPTPLTSKDLSPELAKQGYSVEGGKIVSKGK